ncbi:MAG: 3D domain-containing protein [bacterium]
MRISLIPIALRFILVAVVGMMMVLLCGCARYETRTMEVTAYCGCGECCSWERGSWKYLKLNFWNRYISEGKYEGRKYSGRTADGSKAREVQPGLFSVDSVAHPWMIPVRIIFFPWLLLPQEGTIAADTHYHEFGTEMFVPGYGWGVVRDRGGAIKGPNRLDIYYSSHREALNWGRQNVEVKIKR